MGNLSPRPVVTIVMPLFNAENWVEGTLESIRQQSFADWELVVVNDGSTDSGPDIVERFAAEVPQATMIVNIPNSGPSCARNAGIAQARGEFIAFIDADDLWQRDKLRDQVELLYSSPSAVAAICDYVIQQGVEGPITARRHFSWSQEALKAWALMEDASPCLNSTLLVRRATIDHIGAFHDEMTNVEDLEFAYRLNEMGAVLNTGLPQLTYRMHDFQNHKNRQTIIRDYLVFLNQWTQVSDSVRRRGYANVLLLQATENWRDHRYGAALATGVRSVRSAPLQWARLLIGVRTRRRKSATGGRWRVGTESR